MTRDELADNVSGFIAAIADGITNAEATRAIMVSVDAYVAPSPPVPGVTEEMVERAVRAYYPEAKNPQPWVFDNMRKALTAALTLPAQLGNREDGAAE